MKHTPGPWGWGYTTTNTGTGAHEGALQLITHMQNPKCNDPVVLTVRDDWKGYLTRDPLGKADARLIASAPDLLEMLDTLTAMAEQGDDFSLELFAKDARTLLRKIEGEE